MSVELWRVKEGVDATGEEAQMSWMIGIDPTVNSEADDSSGKSTRKLKLKSYRR